MKFHEEFLTILAVSIDSEDLILRLDKGDWMEVKSYHNQVLEIKLRDCQNIENKANELKNQIGELIWNYEFSEDEKLFKILMEDASEIEIRCVGLLEGNFDLTIDELFSKFKFLERTYQEESKNSRNGWSRYGKLYRLLKFEISNDLEKYERRKNFYEQNHSDKIEKAESLIRFGTKILNLMEQIDKENK